MKIIRRTIKLSKRTLELEIVEEPDKIKVFFTSDPIGELGDANEINQALIPYFDKYDSDPRPLVWKHPITGEVATVIGNANNCQFVIQSEASLN